MKNIIKIALLALGFANSPTTLKVVTEEGACTTISPLTMKEIRRNLKFNDFDIINKDLAVATLIQHDPLNERYAVEFVPEFNTVLVQVTKLKPDLVKWVGGFDKTRISFMHEGRHLIISYAYTLSPFNFEEINFAKLENCWIVGAGGGLFRQNGVLFQIPCSQKAILILQDYYRYINANRVEICNRICSEAKEAGIEVKYVQTPSSLAN